MDAPHLRHMPPLMREIADVDSQIDTLLAGAIFDFADALDLQRLRARRDELSRRAQEIYGHTPARGDRGPSSAGALAA